MIMSARDGWRVRRAWIRKFEQLTWIGSRESMLRGASLDLDRPSPASRKQQTLAFERTQQEPTLARREAKSRIGDVDDLLRLLQQQLHLRVRQDRLAVLRARK